MPQLLNAQILHIKAQDYSATGISLVSYAVIPEKPSIFSPIKQGHGKPSLTPRRLPWRTSTWMRTGLWRCPWCQTPKPSWDMVLTQNSTARSDSKYCLRSPKPTEEQVQLHLPVNPSQPCSSHQLLLQSLFWKAVCWLLGYPASTPAMSQAIQNINYAQVLPACIAWLKVGQEGQGTPLETFPSLPLSTNLSLEHEFKGVQVRIPQSNAAGERALP